MPTLNKSIDVDVWVDADVDIEVEEFFDEMTTKEKQEMFDLLVEDGFKGEITTTPSGHSSWEFDEAIIKLKTNYYTLSKEETDTIISLSKRF